jgi:hypothetical protein
MDSFGIEFYFAAKVSEADGELDVWNHDRHRAAEIAVKHWTQLSPNKAKSAYTIKKSKDPNAPEPHWVERSPEELFRLLCADFQITSLNHPVARYLLGEQIS